MAPTQIIIKRAYFDNIRTTIDAINEFFSSQFKTKNFPSIESDTDVDIILNDIVEYLNNVEPSWIDNPDKVDAAVESINESIEEEHPTTYDEATFSDKIYAYIGYKVLQFIADNFDSFSELLNAIYSFDLFMNPDKYESVVTKMSQPISLSELTTLADSENHVEIFSFDKYVNGIFSNKEYINMGDLDKSEQLMRISDYQPIGDKTEVVIDDSDEDYSDPEYDERKIEEQFHQEAAEVNLFEEEKPKHIKYDEKGDRFIISQQLRSLTNSIVSAIEKCESSEDLKALFSEDGEFSITKIRMLVDNQSPFILNKVFNNGKKCGIDTSNIDNLENYIKSYSSITEKNSGANRFFNYDIFSTFKVDKEGTIQFIKDFLTCDLYNKEDVVITNNTLLTLFNIFDSRIYFDKLYNLIPDSVKKEKHKTEDSFVKKVRSRINKTSHAVKVYDDEKNEDPDKIKSAEEVQEFVFKTMRSLKDVSTTDMSMVDLYTEMVDAEISIVGNLMYNEGVSPVATSRLIQEMEMGDIPDYMKDRLNISDKTADDVTVSPANVPSNSAPIPDNSFDDLATSIDNKINSFDGGNVDDMLGYGYEERKEPSDGKVVYNVTNNYNYSNSFNKNSGNTQNDSSTGKTVNITNTNSNNDSSVTKVHNKHTKPTNQSPVSDADIVDAMDELGENVDDKSDMSNNSNNNREQEDDTIASDISDFDLNKDENDLPETGFDMPDHDVDNVDYNNSVEHEKGDELSDSSEGEEDGFSNGMSVNEFFSVLEAAEPLSDSMGPVNNNQRAEMPEEDPSTHILDVDRKKKKKRDKVKNSITAAAQPIKRTKRWLKKTIDSLVKRDENKVKAEILENDDYRHTLHKAARFAIRIGAIAVAFTINAYVGSALLGIQIMRNIDKKERLTKEVQEEFATELEIINAKIDKAEREHDDKAKWKLMRLRSKMEHLMVQNGTKAGHIPTSKMVM